MDNLNIAIKNKTKIVKELESLYDVEYYEEQTLWQKLTLRDKRYPDIYFHQGIVSPQSLDFVENSRLTIVNSEYIKESILEKKSYLPEEKIHVLYPYVSSNIQYDKQIKKAFRNKHTIHKDHRIIYFTGSDLKQSGLEQFLKIISSLESTNFKVIIETNTQQFDMLNDKLIKFKLKDRVLVLENYPNKDELFISSDIFILPTKQKLFVPNVLKAMYYKNAVFIERANISSELIDSFSMILGNDDRSVLFKIDALLGNKKELKKIQKENYTVVKNLTFENYLGTIKSIIKDKFEI